MEIRTCKWEEAAQVLMDSVLLEHQEAGGADRYRVLHPERGELTVLLCSLEGIIARRISSPNTHPEVRTIVEAQLPLAA